MLSPDLVSFNPVVIKRRGVSLVETVLALSLLSGLIFMVVVIFHTSMRQANAIQQNARAAELAQSVLARLRAEASKPSVYATKLVGLNGTTGTDPDYPGFRYRTAVDAPKRIASPCSGLEQRFTNPRYLDQLVIPVKVEVTWGAQDQFTLALLDHLREPKREVAGLRVTRTGTVSNPVPFNEVVTFEAELLDTSGAPISGVGFLWNVAPETGNATRIESSSSDPKVGKLQHKYYFNPLTSTWGSVPGIVRMEARARYWGQEFVGLSDPVVLQ